MADSVFGNDFVAQKTRKARAFAARHTRGFRRIFLSLSLSLVLAAAAGASALVFSGYNAGAPLDVHHVTRSLVERAETALVERAGSASDYLGSIAALLSSFRTQQVASAPMNSRMSSRSERGLAAVEASGFGTWLGDVFYGIFGRESVLEPASPAPTHVTQTSSATPQGTYATTTRVQPTSQLVIERVVERIIERVTAPATLAGSFVTETFFNTTLADMETRLNQRISSLPVPISGGGSSAPVYTNTFGLSQKIDQLSGTTITNSTITGGSITASSISGTVSAAIDSAAATIAALTATRLTVDNASTTVLSAYDGLFVGRTATTTILGSATSTFAAGVETTRIHTTAASSTMTGLRISGGVQISTLDCSNSGSLLQTDTNGNVICGTDDSGGGGSSFGQAWEIGGNGNAGFLAPTTTQRVWVGQASSTQLSVMHTLYVGGTATTTIDSAGNISARQATTTTLAITNIASSLLKTNANGSIIPAVLGTDYANYAWPFTVTGYGVSTSTTVGFTNGLLSTASSTFTSDLRLSSLGGGTLNVGAGGLLYSGATTTFGGGLTYANGNVTLDWLFPNNATTTAISFSGGITTANASTSAVSANTLAVGGTGTTTISSIGALFTPALTVGSLSGVLKATAGVISAAIAGTDYVTPAGLSSAFPFTTTTFGGTTANATSTLLGFTSGIYSLASSTIGNGSAAGGLTVAGTATTTNSVITALTSSLLKTNSIGQVIAAVLGTDYVNYTWPFTVTGYGVSTSTTVGFTNGLLSTASTTIGSGTQAGGLTISGGATTTGTLRVEGSATSTFANGGISATSVDTTSGTASSTMRGLRIATGGLQISNLTSCAEALETDANGNIVCGTDATGSGSAFPFTPTTAFGGTVNATSTTLQLTSGLYASSTVRFGNAGVQGFFFDGAVGNVGIGTSTPWAQLSVNPNGITGPAFVIGSSTATNFIVTNGGNVGVGKATPGYPLDVIGDINFTGAIREDGNEIFASMIAPFAGSCPTGWSEYTAARGRTVVGTPSGGTNAGTVGTALTDLGTRTVTDVPSHLHAVDPPSTNTNTTGAHTHTVQGGGGSGLGLGQSNPGTGDHTSSSNGDHSHTVDIASFNSGSTGVASVDVTMPYIQLTYCQKAAGADIAEWIPASENIEKATIISTDPDNRERVIASRTAYDNSVVGVVATQPGWLIGQETNDSVQMALAGRVPMRVSLKNGEINIGDPITTSSILGVGMKATKAGPTVGKAMEAVNETSALTACTDPLTGRTEQCATALVFVNISWYSPTQDQSEDIALQFASTYTEPLSIGADFETGDVVTLQYRYPQRRGSSTETMKTGYLMPAIPSSLVAGVISTEIGGPGELLRRVRENNRIVSELRLIPSGKAQMKIAPDSEPIQPGDPIVVSAEDAGRGAKATSAGFIAARAMEEWLPENGTSTISVMMDASWWVPALPEQPDSHEHDSAEFLEYLFGHADADGHADLAFLEHLFAHFIDWLGDAQNGIERVVARVFKGERAEVNELCVGSTCVTEAQFAAVFSATNDNQPSSEPSEKHSSEDPAPVTMSHAPIEIVITGNNPATLHIGVTYADLGATASSSDQSLINLGVRTFYAGQEVTAVSIDTSEAGKHAVTYRVLDANGDVLTEATRTIIIAAPELATDNEQPADPEPIADEPADAINETVSSTPPADQPTPDLRTLSPANDNLPPLAKAISRARPLNRE